MGRKSRDGQAPGTSTIRLLMDEYLPVPEDLEDSKQVSTVPSAVPSKSLWNRVQLVVCSVLLVLAASGQSVCFKSLGYPMRPYPYFILLFVSWSFVPILFALVMYIHIFSGGFD